MGLFSKEKNKVESSMEFEDIKYKKSLKKNIEIIKNVLGNSPDIVIREFNIGDTKELNVAIVYTDGMIDKKLVNDNVIKPIMIGLINESRSIDHYELVKQLGITSGEVGESNNFRQLFDAVLSGDTVLLLDNYKKGLIIGSKGWKDRSVGFPENEPTNVGPQESFTETLRTNTSLIRRRIKHENLRFEPLTIGKYTKTDVNVVYVKGIASDDVIEKVKNRLKETEIEGVLDSAYLERAITDNQFHLLPTIFSTERPDHLTAKLLEGRVGIMVDGSPFVLYVPVFFTDMFLSTADYSKVSGIQYFVIGLRAVGLSISLLVPALYIAFTCYHVGVIPTALQIKLISDYSQIVFPVPLEVIILLVFFEFLREASFRMPVLTSSSILFVGGLVLSQSIVEARLASSVVIIVVSLTVISSFVFVKTSLSNTLRNFRFFLSLLASVLGLYGIAIGLMFMIAHVASLTSMGTTFVANKYKSHGAHLKKRGTKT